MDVGPRTQAEPGPFARVTVDVPAGGAFGRNSIRVGAWRLTAGEHGDFGSAATLVGSPYELAE